MGEQKRWGTWDALQGFRRYTDAEILAEMTTETLVEELKRRGVRVVMDEKTLLLWIQHIRSKEDPYFDMDEFVEEGE